MANNANKNNKNDELKIGWRLSKVLSINTPFFLRVPKHLSVDRHTADGSVVYWAFDIAHQKKIPYIFKKLFVEKNGETLAKVMSMFGDMRDMRLDELCIVPKGHKGAYKKAKKNKEYYDTLFE